MQKYTVAIGKFNWPLTEDQKKVLDMIKEFKGLAGIDPAFDEKWETRKGTLLLFETLNDAKEARNILRAENVDTGTNIMKVEVTVDITGTTIGQGEIVA